MQVVIIQPVEGLSRTNRWKKTEFNLFELRHFSSLALGYQCSCFLGICTQTGTQTIASIIKPWTQTELLRFSWFSIWQTADHGTSGLPQPRESIPIINLLLYLSTRLSLYILVVLFPWKILNNTMMAVFEVVMFEKWLMTLKAHIMTIEFKLTT